MKTCPVCQARTFDDAPVCYGCLHRFNEASDEGVKGDEMPTKLCFEQASLVAPAVQSLTESATIPLEETSTPLVSGQAEQLPEFYIRFTPQTHESGALTWICSVGAYMDHASAV